MKLCVVVAARPNFIKAAPLLAALNKCKVETVLVHTGQHYDYAMSQVFFEELRLPEPDVHLDVGSGTHAEQIGRTMIEMEKVLVTQKPDIVIVFGDVNATLGVTLAAVKLDIRVAHVEAGVRSFDSMPEEMNRRLVDHISHWLFTTSVYDDENLALEAIPQSRIHRVGNIIADTLLANRFSRNGRLRHFGVARQHYALLTLHRAGNVDDGERLAGLLRAVAEIARTIPVVFPVHPRTRKSIDAFGLENLLGNVVMTGPLGYLTLVSLEASAAFVMTDSGGIQVETTVLGVPCLTILDSPLWPITHEMGTNVLVGTTPEKLVAQAFKTINARSRPGNVPDLWDGHTAERIVEVLTR